MMTRDGGFRLDKGTRCNNGLHWKSDRAKSIAPTHLETNFSKSHSVLVNVAVALKITRTLVDDTSSVGL